MGYGYYVLPDGREAGYGVEAECDQAGCDARIDRGLGYLCGQSPDGHRDFEEPGCGKYFCSEHRYTHPCENPECEAFSADGELRCGLAADHELEHRDVNTDETFTETEADVVNEDGFIVSAA